jgi:tRNA (guanine-N7-)-methyltransferase
MTTDTATTDPRDDDFGVPTPGMIVPPERWTNTAYKRFPETGPLDWSAIFGREAPVVLELGSGNGRFTIASALRRPDWNHFAVDVLPVGIRHATRRANQRGLANVRFAVKDAESMLRDFVAPSSLAELHLYHPQPFHDPRQAHRRLITPPFLANVHAALGPGGRLFLQTDCRAYWAYFKRVAHEFFDLQEQRGPWPEDPLGRSRREILARQRGLRVHRAVATRRDDLEPEKINALAESLPKPTFRTPPPYKVHPRPNPGDETE